MTVNQKVLNAAKRLQENPNVKEIAAALFGKNGVNGNKLPTTNTTPPADTISPKPPIVTGRRVPKSARDRGAPPPPAGAPAPSPAPLASAPAAAMNAAPAPLATAPDAAVNATPVPLATAPPPAAMNATAAPEGVAPANLNKFTGINNDAVEATRTMEEAKKSMVNPQSMVRSIPGMPPVNESKALSRNKLNALAASAKRNPLFKITTGGRRSVKTKRKVRRTRNKRTRRTKAKKSRSRR